MSFRSNVDNRTDPRAESTLDTRRKDAIRKTPGIRADGPWGFGPLATRSRPPPGCRWGASVIRWPPPSTAAAHGPRSAATELRFSRSTRASVTVAARVNAQRHGLQRRGRGDLEDPEPLLCREHGPLSRHEREGRVGPVGRAWSRGRIRHPCAGFMCAVDPGDLDFSRWKRGPFESYIAHLDAFYSRLRRYQSQNRAIPSRNDVAGS